MDHILKLNKIKIMKIVLRYFWLYSISIPVVFSIIENRTIERVFKEQ